MPFTQAQKGDIKSIIQETIRELFADKTFIASIALKVADTLDIPREIDKNTEENKKQITNLHSEIESVNLKIRKIEQFNRRNNIRIYGIPEKQNEQREDLIQTTARITRMNFSGERVDLIYRIGKTTQDGNRAIFVRFKQYEYKEEVMRNRSTLKGTEVILADDLTKENHAILKEAVLKLGKRNVWCLGGKIYCRKGENKIILNSMEDIAKQCSA